MARNLLDFYKSSPTARRLVAEICVGVVTVTVCLLIFLKLMGHVNDKEIIFFDNSITHFIHSFSSQATQVIMTTLSFLGSEFLIIATIIVMILLILRNHKNEALVFWTLVFFGTVLNHLLKNIFQRLRPNEVSLLEISSYSFPSGHSMVSFVFYMSLAYIIFRNTRNKKIGIILLFVFSLLVFGIGISRVYLGKHYPSDCIAGFAAGLAWLCLILLIEKIAIFLRLFGRWKLKKN